MKNRTDDPANGIIKVFPDDESVARAAAEIFVKCCRDALTRSFRFSAVLCGGRSPLRMFKLLGEEPFRSQIDWAHVHIFWGDERCVPASDSRSNYGSAARSLLSRVEIPATQIHPILYESDPISSAAKYEVELRKYLEPGSPLFDLVFLGLGEDGHTASLFPGAVASKNIASWVIPCQKTNETIARITMTTERLNLSRTVLFLVTGKEKARIFRAVQDERSLLPFLPAQLIHPKGGELLWFLDRAAFGNGGDFGVSS